MKKIYYLIFLISNLIFSQTVATSLQVQDTRDTNSPPSGYLKEVRAELKAAQQLVFPEMATIQPISLLLHGLITLLVTIIS